MINKIVHYVWVGDKPMNDTVKSYVKNWQKVLGKEWKIMLWDNDSFDFDSHPFTKYHYAKKNWALVSDFLRAYAVYTYGGFYLDADIELKKTLDPLTKYDGVFSFVVSVNVTASSFGAKKGEAILKGYMDIYANERIIKEQPKAVSADIMAYLLWKKMPWPETGETFIKGNYVILDEKVLQVPIDNEGIAVHNHFNNWKGKEDNPEKSKFFYYKIKQYKKPETIEKMKKYVREKHEYLDQIK